jgi:hypothetical protein
MAVQFTYVPIATQTLGSATASVTFSSIPSTYQDLHLVVSHKFAVTTSTGVSVTFNSDNGTNYSYTNMYGNGSSAASSRATSSNYIVIGNGDDINFNIAIADIMNYSNSTTYKSVIARGTTPASFTTAWAGLWRNTSAITSLTFTNNSSVAFVAGTVATLYGLAAA